MHWSIDGKQGRLVNYVTGLFTRFDSASYIEKLYVLLNQKAFKNGGIIGERNIQDDKIRQLYLQHWSHLDGQPMNIGNNFITDNYQHILNDEQQLQLLNTSNNFTQGPSVANLSCYIANGQNCTTPTNNMYTFNSSILNTMGYLKQQFLFDMKRNGDHLQVLATHKLNATSNDGNYYIFCSIDRLAIQFARLIGVPCILINNTSGEMTLYKGNFNQIPGNVDETVIQQKIKEYKISQLQKKINELEAIKYQQENFLKEKIEKNIINLEIILIIF